MALCRTVAPIRKFIKPVLVNPCFLVPCSVNMQVRYAARKGYREKKRIKKEAAKLSTPMTKEIYQLKKKIKMEKTLILKKPEPPPDDIIIRDNFNYLKYSLSEAVKLHREYHHPTVYNNPEAPVNLKIEINMTGKSQFQFIKPFSGIASIPHPFVLSYKKEVLVLCEPEDVNLAVSCGASVAGCDDVIKKIKEGSIQPSLYEYVIAHINVLPKLTPIRNNLKNQMPKAKQGTLTNDLKSAIHRFLHGIEYSCVQLDSSKDTGFISCTVGLINMELEQLEENLKALIEDIEKKRPPKKGEFISWIWCLSPPSNESFLLDLSKYIEKKEDDDDDDDDEDDEGEEMKENKARLELQDEYSTHKMFEEKI